MKKSRNLILLVLGITVLAALIAANWPRRPTETATGPPATVAPSAGSAAPAEATQAEAAPSAERIPHFHARLEDALPLPKILPASQFRIPVVARAYRIAAQIPEVLAQQPCYCWCDKIGHGSLVDCFATEHGAG